MKPVEIRYSNEGLTETTIELISGMGPLLLEIAPDGRTPLQYVQAMWYYASSSGSDTLSGVYYRIKSSVDIEIMDIEKQQKANGEPCWSS
jgi:hypothetical protein